MKRIVMLAMLAMPVLTGCKVFTVPEGVPWDVSWGNPEPGDRVDVEMQPAILDGRHPWDRCMHMGGRLMRVESSTVAVGTAPVPGPDANGGESAVSWAIIERLICEGVDFR